ETCQMVEIAEHANFEISTLSRAVADLEAKQYIERNEAEDSQRIKLISLAPRGEQIIQEMLPVALQQEAATLEVLSAGERLMLVELLNKLDRRLDELGAG